VADVSIKKSAPATSRVGFHVVYTLTITNNGPSTAEGVKVIDVLPPGLTGIVATTTKGACTVGVIVTCNVGSLTRGEVQTVTIIAAAPIPGILVNTASVTETTSDPTPGNNSATATTIVT
jgi:uncharacterized repeat protein (TIGR01451 family)